MVVALSVRFALLGLTVVHGATEENHMNPIRKVVTLLQKMQKKVQDEGERESELYEKFQCYCKTGKGDLAASIGAAEEKVASLTSSLEAGAAKLAGAKSALEQAQADRAAAKTAMSEATALREKEAATFASFKSDHEANVAAIAKAVDAISKGVAGSFLQTPAAQVLRHALSRSDLGGADQEEVVAFLSHSTGYVPQSGEILGILKQMGDEMAGSLADGTATEKDAIATYKGLMAAKTKEVGVLQSTIESKTQLVGDLSVSNTQMDEDLTDTKETLAEDKKFLAELEKGCETKAAEWEERSKTRSEELLALADTIKVLNDDDALELFKKTLPSSASSLIQVKQGMHALRAEALAVLRSAKPSAMASQKAGLDTVMLALSDQSSGGFGKVIKLIDDLVKLLGQDQTDDDNKKDYCAAQLDAAEDKKKGLDLAVSDANTAIAKATEQIATLDDEMAALTAGIKALDKSVADATAQRKAENAEYKALVASDTAAQEVLAFAKNRLNKFYNPKLYKPPPKVELSEDDRIFVNNGGELVTAAPGGIAGTGITVFAQVSAHKTLKAAPAPPPDTWGAYSSKSHENNGVIAMIDLLSADLQKELTEAGVQEKDDQAEYEQLMKDSADKRALDSKSLSDKGAAKADTEAALQAHKEAGADAAKEGMLTAKLIASLHGECDWLLQYYDARKAARVDEVDSLKRAKAVLSGADYSLIQQAKSHGFLRGN